MRCIHCMNKINETVQHETIQDPKETKKFLEKLTKMMEELEK